MPCDARPFVAPKVRRYVIAPKVRRRVIAPKVRLPYERNAFGGTACRCRAHYCRFGE